MAYQTKNAASDYSNVKAFTGTGQAKTVSATSVAFTALPVCAGVRVDAEVDVWVEVGNVAVVATSTHIFAGQSEYIKAGEGDVVHILAASSAGLAYVRPFQ